MSDNTTQPKRRGRGPARMTEDFVRQLHKEWKSGLSYTKLSEKHKVAKSTISEAFDRHSLREPRMTKYPEPLVRKMHKHWLQTKSYKMVAEKFNVPRPVLWASFRKYGLQTAIHPRTVPKQRYSREDAVKLHEYWLKNGYKATAEHFKVPHQSLWSLFRRFDLTTTHRTGESKKK